MTCLILEYANQTSDKVCCHLDFLHASEPSKHPFCQGFWKAAARYYVTPSSTADSPRLTPSRHLGPPNQSVTWVERSALDHWWTLILSNFTNIRALLRPNWNSLRPQVNMIRLRASRALLRPNWNSLRPQVNKIRLRAWLDTTQWFNDFLGYLS
jgi:hypothetical protein